MPSVDISSAFSFPTLERGYAVISEPSATSTSTGIASTTDGGGHWTVTVTESAFAPFAGIAAVAFTTPDQGWAWAAEPTGTSSTPNLFSTSDAGRTWSAVPGISDVTDVLPLGESVWVLTDGTAGTRSVAGTPTATHLVVSNDGGATWRKAESVVPAGAGMLSRVDTTTAYALVGATLEETTDRGDQWSRAAGSRVPICPDAGNLNAPAQGDHFAATSLDSMWLICAGSASAGSEEKTVYRSSNGGRTWTEVASVLDQPNPDVGNIPSFGYAFDGSLVAVSATNAYFCLGRLGLIETSDGGRTWTVPINKYTDQCTIDMSSPKTGVVMLSHTNPTFWHTTNGVEWTPLPE
ncbi:MAG: glycoside hydrolase [Actinomycetota bacterium]|nr:glycoside hydrolase [Actinomycetota bacterium]